MFRYLHLQVGLSKTFKNGSLDGFSGAFKPRMQTILQTTPNYVWGGVSNIFIFVFAFVCLSIDAKTAKNNGRLW